MSFIWPFLAAISASFAAEGQQVTYERVFGGSNVDTPTSVATDLQGNVIVVGTADLIDFPTTPGSYKPSVPGPLEISRNGAGALHPFASAGPIASKPLRFPQTA